MNKNRKLKKKGNLHLNMIEDYLFNVNFKEAFYKLWLKVQVASPLQETVYSEQVTAEVSRGGSYCVWNVLSDPLSRQ